MWDQLFGLTNLAALGGWAVLLAGPRRWLPVVRYAGVGFLATVYVVLFVALNGGLVDPVRDGPAPSLADYSVRGLRALFASDGGIVVGWTHYLAFDLFVGCWIAEKADARGVGRLAQVPVLLATFMAGPAGLLLWFVVQRRRDERGAAMTGVDTDDRAAILAVLAGQDEAWCAGDAAAFGARCLPDVVFTNVVGMFSVGKAPFDAQHAHIFATIYRSSRLTQKLVHIAMPTPDVAVVDTLTAVSGAAHLPPGAQAIDGALRTRLEQVMVRRDGGSRVQAVHNVPVNPAAAAVAGGVTDVLCPSRER